jgi:hypothetical protein
MVLRAFALLLLVGTVGLWAGLGGRLEWTQTQAPKKEAGIGEARPVFVPGVEFLALGVGGAFVIFAATLFVRITPKSES